MSWDLTSHNFSQPLSDLANSGERGLASLQVFLVRVDVGLLRERRVIVARPLSDDRYRHARPRGGAPGLHQPPPRDGGSRSRQTGSSLERLQSQQARMDQYMRSVAGGSAGEIERAKGLLDSGAITQAEFDSIKAKALGG